MHRLPVSAYTSQEWFDREQDKIFSKVWRYAGFIEDVTEPGQYISVQAGLNNIFVVMTPEGELRAFHNICRHRGTQLLRAIGKTNKAIVCPYHDWTYNLNGELVSVPGEKKEFGEVDKSCLGLKPASVGVWRGMLFVHPDPAAVPVSEWFGDVEPRLGPYRVEELVEYGDARAEYEIKANWKIVVENYIDVYHLSHLHAGTLNMYDHSRAEYGFVGPHYAFFEPLTPEYEKDIERKTPAPLIVPKDRLGTWVPMLFPGIGLGESESSWSTFILTPLAPDLTRVESRTRLKNTSSWEFGKQSWKSASYWSKKIRPKYQSDQSDDPMASGDFMAEDIFACEQQQKSLSSPHFSVGPVSAGETPIVDHQGVVLDYVNHQE